MRIKKGDTVKIIKGKDRGKTGKVLHVFPEEGRILVEGVNLYKKHVRPKRQGEKGETVTLPRPFQASNSMLLCPRCGRPTRVGHRVVGTSGSKERYCKKCQSVV